MAIFDDGNVIGTWKSYVDPEDYFDTINVSIHGIDEKTVLGAPKFPEILSFLSDKFTGDIFVHHTAFDRYSLNSAAWKYNNQFLDVRWLDSACVARRVWEQFSRSGFSLSNLADYLKIDFVYHDALEDARVAGLIVWRAICESGHSIDEWLELAHKRLTPSSIAMDGNQEGPFCGETLVFTGALSMPRAKAAVFAAQAGCEVDSGITAKTTLLVVGDQDLKKLAGYEKSGKHRRAEELIAQGHEIRILSESDFMAMINNY